MAFICLNCVWKEKSLLHLALSSKYTSLPLLRPVLFLKLLYEFVSHSGNSLTPSNFLSVILCVTVISDLRCGCCDLQMMGSTF